MPCANAITLAPLQGDDREQFIRDNDGGMFRPEKRIK